jgi:hypothetical protein
LGVADKSLKMGMFRTAAGRCCYLDNGQYKH